MQALLRLLASWKGITVEPGTELRLELLGFPSGGAALLVLLIALAACVLVVAFYRKDAGGLPRGRRMLLLALRVVAVLSALLLVLEPSLVAVKREVRPGHTLLLLDLSQSMNHKDAFRRQEVADRATAWRTLGIADPANASRLELAKAMLAHQDQALVRELAGKNKVLAYGFSTGAEPLAVQPPRGEPVSGVLPETRLDLDKLVAEGRHSNLGGAVRQALEKSRDASVAGVIVLSDGRRNMGPQGQEIARLLAQRKVPHTLVLGVGDPSETQLVALTRVDAPEKVFQKDPFRLAAHLATQGYDPTSVAVRFVQVPPTGGAGTVVQSKTVQIGGKLDDMLVEFPDLKSEQPGLYTYRVEIDPPSGEALVAERHHKSTQIEVLAEQTRVLLVAGGPSFEYRILTNFLIRDKTVNVSCWLTSADPDFPQDGDTPIKALPADRKELAAYDVFLLLDPDPTKLSKEWCEHVSKQVQDDGAGLWWSCGEKFTLEALRDTANTKPLAELLPVVPDLKAADTDVIGFGKGFEIAWPFQLTPEGEANELLRVVEGKDDNKLHWRRLPGHYWAFPVQKPKPAALVLLGHSSPKLKRSDGPMPLIATHFLGAGRVIFSGIDETYRWRSLFEDSYNKFWIQGIRYLNEGRMVAGNTRFRIRLSSEKAELGEPIKITVEAQDEFFRPLTAGQVEVALRKDGGAAETLKIGAVAEAPGRYELLWQPPSAGFYRLAPAAKSGKDVESTLQVVPAAIEKEGAVDLAELAAIASVPGGQVCALPSELVAAAAKIPSLTATDVFRTPHAIWDSWATIAWLLCWLALEWWLRKRSNLL